LPSRDSNVDALNNDAQAVIAGTATNPNSGNTTEPALPASVFFVDIDTLLGADTSYFASDHCQSYF
jgi:hypothetical protein